MKRVMMPLSVSSEHDLTYWNEHAKKQIINYLNQEAETELYIWTNKIQKVHNS